MKNLELYQVVIDPGSLTDIEKAMLAMNHRQHLKPGQKLKLWTGKHLHPLGIHHWVTWKTWDRSSNRVLTIGRTCAFCALGAYT